MRRINIYDVVELGEGLTKAQSVNEKSSIIDAWFGVYALGNALDKISSGQLIEFGIGKHYVDELFNAVKDIASTFQQWQDSHDTGKDIPNIDWTLQYNLRSKMDEFKTVLAAESRTSATYYVSKVGIYSTSDLIEDATKKFSPETRSVIDAEALDQFQDSAKCLAYSLNTACAFHMMRAIEASLLSLMRLVCGKSFASLNANWGAYIAELEKINNGRGRKKVKKETIDLLRQIKNNHRNPVMHAELNLTRQEALDIFDLGSVVISHVSQEIDHISKGNCRALVAAA
ncbi:MAG: hypothetical protein KGN34_17180 [Sphingomonadales bacterium]|nr:hypothetical protein [Sphingomonadales bacterium]